MKRLEGGMVNTTKYWNETYNHPGTDDFYIDDSRYLMLAQYVQNGDVFLDAGCADGCQCFVVKTARPGASVFGIDYSSVAIKKANTYYGHLGIFSVGDVTKTEFDDNTFDTIICGEVIEHLEEPEKLIKELTRITKKGGRVLITCPYKETEERRISLEHRWSFDGPDIKKMADKLFSEAYFFPWASGRGLVVRDTGEILYDSGHLDILLTLLIK